MTRTPEPKLDLSELDKVIAQWQRERNEKQQGSPNNLGSPSPSGGCARRGSRDT